MSTSSVVSGYRRGEGLECGRLVVVGLDVAVRHRAEDGDAVELPGQDVGGACRAGEVAGAGDLQRRLGAVGATGAELDHVAPGGRRDHPRRLRRRHDLEVHLVEHERLDQLSLPDRRHDLDQRLVGEDDGPFGHRPDLAAEPEVAQPLQERLGEPAQRAQVVPILLGDAEGLQGGEHVVEPGGDEVIADRRQLAEEQLEDRRPVHPLGLVGPGHGQLVQVGE